MKKRIVSMILALSMMLSILPVSAFADAGAGLSSAAAKETNSITYSSQNEHEDVGTNSETNNQVVKIKTGTNGLPKAATGTGWSYDETTGLTITGTGSEDTEYILDGTVSCNVTVKNANSYTVYLLDGTVTGTLLIEADNMYGVYVLGGSYADVQLNLGTIDGGTYDKLTENGGNVRGGFFRDISGLNADTQQQAHQLLLPENCTLNGRKETGDIYIIKEPDYLGTGNNLELVVESDTPCDGWAVATTSSNGGVMPLPAGVTDYNFTYNGNVIAKISISEDGRTLSASFSMIPMSGNAPMKLVTIQSMSKELSFTNEGLPDLTGVTCVESLDEGENKCQAYLCRNWTYVCYPNMPNLRGVLMMADQGGREIDLKALSPAPINCAVQLTNATVTDAAFGEKGALALTSGKITGGIYPEARVGISTTDGTGKVEITGGVFDSLSCYGECTISNAVILDCTFSTFFDNSKFAVSDTVFGELPDALEDALAAGQKISKLVVRNGNVTAINGRSLTLSTNTIYLVGAGTADITLDTDVLSINEEAVENYNANTSAAGKVLRITGNNDGKDILVNKSTDVGAVKPLRITEDGLPDLTGVEPKKVTGEGMEITLYEGQGWKYGIMSGKDESGVQRTASQILITSPDGSPVDLTSREINPSQAALKSDGITLQDVTVTSMYADAPVELNNAVIESGYFQKEVTLDRTSTIAGGVFDATVKLRDNAKITAGVFQDIELPGYASEAVVIENAVILGSLTGNNSKAAVSDTLSLSRIDSAYLAAGQQQSELRSMDGVMTDVNGNSVADAAAVYRIGDAALVLTFTKPVTNINGEPVSAYAGASLSADGKTLFLNGRNDGADIVVNQTGETTEKLPFKGFKAENFDWAKNEDGTYIQNEDGTYTLICTTAEGVGKLTAKFECITGVNKGKIFINEIPNAYGRYQATVIAEEGEKYKAGSIDLGAVSLSYEPEAADFSYDAAQNKVTYIGENYYDADPTQVTLLYGTNRSETVPTAPGRYDVYVRVDGDENYYNSTTEKVGTYVVPEKYTLTVDDKSTEHAAGEKLSFTADEKDGYTFTGWEVTGLPTDVDTSKATITFKMPANNVTLKAQYTENAPETYELKVTDAKVTLKDGGAVADLTAVRVGTELVATAPEKDGYTFTGWEVTGLPADVDTTKATITFKMPANNVTLTPQYKKNTYTLTVDGVDEQHVAGDDINFIASDKEGYTFSYWKAEGVPEGTDTTKANIRFTMPANNVTLEAQYKQNTYTLTVNGKPEQRTFGEEVTLIARKPEGMTFSYWEIKKGLAADAVDVRSEKITFTMPANDVEISAIYNKVPTPDPDPETKTHKLNVLSAQIFLKDGSDVADLTAVPVGTELKAIAYEDTETNVFKCWTGLELTEEQRTARVVYFTMPDHDVNLVAEFVTPTKPEPKTYELKVTDAKVTLKDGGAVADLTAVPAGTELKATADEDTETSVFKNWSCTGLELTEEQRTAHEMYFTMPDHDVNLVAEFVTPTKPDPAPETYKLIVSYAKITLKDGSAVADLKAVPAGTELKATADEDTETSVFKNWNCTGLELTEEQRTARVVEFTMPDHDVELTAVFKVPATPDPDPTPAPGGDGGGAAIVAVAAVGGAAIGVGAYIAGTTAYLKSVLPEGMAIPANRQQLAVALWTAAGKPATQSTALFNDVAADAAELQAIRWVVETGLMTAQDGNFKPGSRVSRLEVIRTWKNYQQRG